MGNRNTWIREIKSIRKGLATALLFFACVSERVLACMPTFFDNEIFGWTRSISVVAVDRKRVHTPRLPYRQWRFETGSSVVNISHIHHPGERPICLSKLPRYTQHQKFWLWSTNARMRITWINHPFASQTFKHMFGFSINTTFIHS